MIKSMTAFGRAKGSVNGKEITVEIRSVNNRFFDCSTKLPRAFSFLEEKIKPHLQSRSISRGKVDVFISIDVIDTPDVEIDVDEGYTAAYINALRKLRDRFGLTDDISVMSVAANKEIFVIKKSEEDTEKEWADLLTVLDEAIDKFLAAREREGENICRDLEGKITAISNKVSKIETISLADTKEYRSRLEQKLKEMLSDSRIVFDENRILTECAIFADKIAIDEELVRLRSHFGAFTEIAAEAAPSGKKLDFLMQELNRETNTIGSKANNGEIAHLVVEMKNELEKIREQVQNVE